MEALILYMLHVSTKDLDVAATASKKCINDKTSLALELQTSRVTKHACLNHSS